MMRMHYDPEADAFSVHFAPKEAYVDSEEVAPGVILDYDADGQVIGVEVLDVSARMGTPRPRREGRPAMPAETPAIGEAS